MSRFLCWLVMCLSFTTVLSGCPCNFVGNGVPTPADGNWINVDGPHEDEYTSEYSFSKGVLHLVSTFRHVVPGTTATESIAAHFYLPFSFNEETRELVFYQTECKAVPGTLQINTYVEKAYRDQPSSGREQAKALLLLLFGTANANGWIEEGLLGGNLYLSIDNDAICASLNCDPDTPSAIIRQQ